MASRKLRQNESPFSEDQQKQHKEWDEEACIAELQRLARAYPERVISRNFFRVNSLISESTWTRYFGTFTEFKRQAGITPTRQQHLLEKHIAKHAAQDHYREFNKARADYGQKYKRANAARFQTIMSCGDLHDKNCDRFFLKVFLDSAKRIQPDTVILNGDIFDMPEFGRYVVDPRSWNPVERIEFVHKEILGPIRKACPDAEIIFVEGNHEFRLLRHLADATPAMLTVLSDLHGMTVPGLLGLDEFEIRYVAKADLAAYTLKDIREEVGKSYVVLHECFLAHHHPAGKQLGLPGINSHHHQFIAWSMYNETFGSYQWLQLGCGHVTDAEYCDGQKWNKGFGIHHIDTEKKIVNHEYVPVTEFAVVGGKFYYRD